MSQTPTYWRRVKLRLIDGAVAYAEILDREAQGEDLGRELTNAYSRYNWDLFELGPRNLAALAERALARADTAAGVAPAAIQTLASRATELARAQIHCNHADKARRVIWRQAHDRYDEALEALGPRGLADLVRRDLFPNDLIYAAVEEGDGASETEDARAPRPGA
ncbi:hypothetical protein [Variovorax sp. LjRoot178]|uniref:hypothetical protein n=1 Tax=Variovorax sp. LjRoot178 TaxID=3342277 RepID=UPI003ECD0305